MAGNNDFYVSFGSDAPEFARKLKDQLAPARREIALFQADLAKLGEGPAGSNLARLLLGIKAARGGGPPATTTPAAAPPPGASIDFAEMAREAASYRAEMDGVIHRMVTLVTGMEKFARQSQGSKRGNESRVRDPKTGRVASPSDPDAVPFVSSKGKGKGGGGVGQVTITGTPKVMIDDAAFKRVVSAVEKQTTAAKDVRRSVDKLYDLVDQQARASLTADRNSEKSGGGKKGGKPEPKEKIDPARDAAFTRASELRNQIAQRERLAALQKVKGAQTSGADITPAMIKAAAGGSGSFGPAIRAGNTGRVQKAIAALQESLKGVPKLKQLEAQLADAVTATGTADGKRTGAYAEAAQERRQAARNAKAAPKPAAAAAKAQQAKDTSVEALRAERDASAKELQGVLAQLTAVRDAVKAEATKGGGGKGAKSSAAQIKAEAEAANRELREAMGAQVQGKGDPDRVAKAIARQEAAQAALGGKIEGNLGEAAGEHEPKLSKKDQKKLADLEAHMATLSAKIAELQKPLKRETRASNRATAKEARAAAPERLNQGSRANQARDIAIAGDEDSLRTRVRNRDLTKSDLQRIAGTFTKQGYDTPYNTKTTNEGLISGILASRKKYDEAGGATVQDLTTNGKVVATEISKGVRKLIRSIVKAAKDTAVEEFARDIIAENFATGGTSSATQSRSGQARTPNHPVRGAAFGGRGDDIVAAAESALRGIRNVPRGAPRVSIDEVIANPQSQEERKTAASLRTAQRRLQAQPNFNPYDPALRAGVKGKGDEAVAARAALNSLTRSIEAIDKELDKAILAPAVRAGVENRKQARDAFKAERSQREQAMRADDEIRSSLKQGVADAVGGASTTLGTGRTNASMTRLFPGISVNRGVVSASDPTTSRELYTLRRNQVLGRNEGPIQAPEVRPFAPETLKGVQKAFQKWNRALQGLAKLGTDRTPEELEEAQRQVALGEHRFIEQYEKAAKTTLRTSNSRSFTNNMGYDPSLEYGQQETYRSYGMVQQRAALAEDKKVDAASRARSRAAGPNPATLKQVSANAQALAKRIAGVKYDQGTYRDKKGAEVDIKELRRQYDAAINPLIVELQKELERGRRGIERHGVDGAAPTDPKALKNFNKYQGIYDSANAGLDQLQPTATSSADDAARAKYLDAYRIQKAKRAAAIKAFNSARDEHFSGSRVVSDKEGASLNQNALYEDYLLKQMKPPTSGARSTKADQLAALQQSSAAYAAQTRAAYDTARGKKPAAGGGGGGTGGDVPPTGGRPTPEGRGGSSNSILQKILAELVKIHAVVNAGIKINHTVGRRAPGKPRAASDPDDLAAAANSTPRQAKRKQQRESAAEYSTAQGRAAFFNSLPDDLAASMANEDKLAAATKLVTRGFLNQKDAVALFRQELKLSRVEAEKLAADLRAKIGDQSLTGSASRGQQRDSAKADAQAAILRAHGGYDPALGYGTMRDQAQAAQKSGEQARALARSQISVADTARRVTKETQAEVAALRQLIVAGASSEKIAEAQINAYRALNGELQAQGVKAAERGQRISQVMGHVGAPNSAGELNDVRRAASLTQGPGASDTRARAQQDGETFGSQMGQASGSAFQRAFFGNNGFASRVVNSVGTFLVRNASAGLVFGLTNALGDAIDQGIHTESTFVRVSEALEKTGRSSAGLRTSLQGLSEEYGVALKDVYTTTAGLTGLFDSSDKGNQQLLSLTRVAVQLQLISGGALNATEAMRSLSSITAAYGDVSAQHIADVATTIQNQLGVNIEDTIEGVARLSGQTKVMGIDFEHAATYVAAISKLTNQSGAASGEQFSRILESFQGGKTQSVVSQALKGVGVDTRGAFAARDYQGAIDALLGSYTKLSKAEQARVSTQIGGARQAASINALLQQGAKVLGVEGAALSSNGAAQERAAKISEQLAAQLNRARQAFVNFFAVLVRSGVLNALGLTLEVVLRTLGAVNKTLSSLNDIIDGSSFLSTVRQWGLAIGGLVLGFVLARKAAMGLMAVMNAGLAGRLVAGRAVAAAPVAEEGALAGGAAPAVGASTVGQAGLLGLLLGRGGRGKLPPAERVAAQQALYQPRYRPGVTPAPSPIDERGRAARFFGGTPRNLAGTPGLATYGPYGPTDQNGVPLRATQRLYARQSVRFANVSDRAAVRAASLSARAEQNLAGASYGSNLGYGSVAAARAQQAGAVATRGLSGAAQGASSGFAKMARSTSLANFAMIGIGAAAALLIEGMQSFNATANEVAAAYKSAFGTDKGPDKSTRAGQNESAFDAILAKNKDENTGFSGVARAFTHTVSDPSSLLHAVTLGQFGSNQGQSDRDTGTVSDQTWIKAYAQPMTRMFHRLGASAKNVGELDKAIAANEKDLTETAEKIDKSDLSAPQKASLYKDLSKLQGMLQQSGGRLRLAAEGINQLDALTQDQLEGIGPMVTALAGFSTTVTKNFAPLLSQYIASLGLDSGSDYAPELKALAKGTRTVDTGRRTRAGASGLGVDARSGRVGQYDANGQFQAASPSQAKTLTGDVRANGGSLPTITDGSGKRITKQVPLTQNQKSNMAIKLLEQSLKASEAQIAATTDPTEKNARIATAIQLAGQLDGLIQQKLQRLAADASALADSARLRGDYAGAASTARQAIAAARAQYNEGAITKAQLDDQTAQIQSQAANDRVTGATLGLQREKARTRNSIRQAQLELQIANTTLSTLEANGGSADAIQAAAIQQEQAINALQDAQAEESLAALSTRLNRNVAPSDAVGKARAQLTIALATQRDAATRFGTDSTQYQQAVSGVIDAQRGVTSALQTVAEANSNLAIAYASAAGHTVQAAKLQLQAAQRKLQEAVANSGGDTSTADVKNAKAAVVTAQGAVRDALFSTTLDTINFNQQMGYASSAATIGQLQQLLKMKDLTNDQRRQVLLQIHQLQQSLVSDLTSSGFNIPSLGNVKLPTPYEVRRSLGVDKLQQTMKDAVDLQGGGFSLTTPTGAGSSSEMINAINKVSAAVIAKGAQNITVDQQNTFQTPSAAAAKAIAAQVIAIINQQTGQQSRATSTTPRTVSTK